MNGTLTFITIMTVIFVLTTLAVIWLRFPYSFVRLEEDPLLTKTLIVHTRDEHTIRGILLASHADRLTLTQAIYVGNQVETELNGLVHIDRDNIRFMQEMESGANTDTMEKPRLKVADK